MKFKVFRDWLQQMIYKIINPIVHGMIKIGITPNFITTTGLILNIVAACIFLYAGMKGERGDFYYISLFSIMGAKIPQQRAPNPVNTTRSGRCMKPTLHSSPNPSARART